MNSTNLLLGGAKSSTSLDSTNYINIQLIGKNKLLPMTSIDEKIDLYTLYQSERDNCTKYRLIFALNSVCSNVLFNKKTEVVGLEGSDSCFTLSDYTGIDSLPGTIKNSLTYKEILTNSNNSHGKELKLVDAIRDTEYSLNGIGGLTYHCGADICNNHMLRAKEFSFVNTLKNKNGVFNTIEDYIRTEDGKNESGIISMGVGTTEVDLHIYRVDSVMSVSQAFSSSIIEKDGWFGFNNISNLEAYNTSIANNPDSPSNGSTQKSINKVVNNEAPCSFIDMYPGRDLYSFVPLYNAYKRRPEYNWDFLITYPYKSDYDVLKLLNHPVDDDGKSGQEQYNGEKSDSIYIGTNYERIYTNNGNTAIRFMPKFNHNLHVGRYVNIYYSYKSNGVWYEKEIPHKIQVVGVGDDNGNNKEKYFTVAESDVLGEVYLDDRGIYACESRNIVHFSYKRNSNNIECSYYVRMFKKMYFDEEQKIDYKYNLSKLAFGNNIYGDSMGQLVYTNDINISGLKDNLGRDLSEIYLTIIKTNVGHEAWYDKNKHIEDKDDKVEYSHCFGKVTSGFEMNGEYSDYNVKRMHNVSISNFDKYVNKLKSKGLKLFDDDEDTYTSKDLDNLIVGAHSLFGDNFEPPLVLEDNITKETYDNSECLIGDIVEFDPDSFTETVLSKIGYRFNTAQRECINYEYFNLYNDEIVKDDYDFSFRARQIQKENRFRVKYRHLNASVIIKGLCAQDEIEREEYVYPTPGNIAPEGYFYYPHNKIILRELSDDLMESNTERLNIDFSNTDDNFFIFGKDGIYDEVYLTSPRNYNFVKGGGIAFYDVNNKKTIWGTIDSVINKLTILVRVGSGSNMADLSSAVQIEDDSVINSTTFIAKNAYKIKNSYKIMYVTTTVPTYAIFRESTGTYIWRPTKAPSETATSSPLYNAPFSNGSIYLENNINLFLKRQDPLGENYLFNYIENVTLPADMLGTDKSSFMREWGAPKLDLRYLLDGYNEDITLC